MTDNDNKDPHIREAFEKWYGSSPEKCSEYPNQYRNMVIQARWEAWRDCHLQQAAELSQLKEKNAAQADVINTEIGTFAENNRLKTELKQLRAVKDGAYSERNKLVAALSKLFPAWLERHLDSDTTWEDDWRWIVFIQLPTGQASWHIHDSELEQFNHLECKDGNSWDGHTTDEKYSRLASITGIPELKQLRAERQWQDISTAPKDGTKILAYLIDNAEHRKSFPENERNGIDIIVWTNHNKGGWISNRFGTPTLWVPLLDKLTDSAQRVTNKEEE